MDNIKPQNEIESRFSALAITNILEELYKQQWNETWEEFVSRFVESAKKSQLRQGLRLLLNKLREDYLLFNGVLAEPGPKSDLAVLFDLIDVFFSENYKLFTKKLHLNKKAVTKRLIARVVYTTERAFEVTSRERITSYFGKTTTTTTLDSLINRCNPGSSLLRVYIRMVSLLKHLNAGIPINSILPVLKRSTPNHYVRTSPIGTRKPTKEKPSPSPSVLLLSNTTTENPDAATRVMPLQDTAEQCKQYVGKKPASRTTTARNNNNIPSSRAPMHVRSTIDSTQSRKEQVQTKKTNRRKGNPQKSKSPVSNVQLQQQQVTLPPAQPQPAVNPLYPNTTTSLGTHPPSTQIQPAPVLPQVAINPTSSFQPSPQLMQEELMEIDQQTEYPIQLVGWSHEPEASESEEFQSLGFSSPNLNAAAPQSFQYTPEVLTHGWDVLEHQSNADLMEDLLPRDTLETSAENFTLTQSLFHTT